MCRLEGEYRCGSIAVARVPYCGMAADQSIQTSHSCQVSTNCDPLLKLPYWLGKVRTQRRISAVPLVPDQMPV